MNSLDKFNELINKNALTELLIIKLMHENLRRPHIKGELIDIIFIFQAASFWPSWETVWEACIEDKRFNPIMLVCDDPIKETVQFKTAQDFLNKLNIPFKHVSKINLTELNPHIIVLHTPYDGHRPRYLHGKRLTALGFRVIYITYGIEISDINKARNDHFSGGVTTTAWRIYTFSKEMIPYYKIFSPTGGDMVRSLGHPKFDKLNKIDFPSLPHDIINQAKGRKILLWKVHFPKKINGEFITPNLNIYKKLLLNIRSYKDLFIVFMPHPKFYSEFQKYDDVDKFRLLISSAENIYEYNEDDYRPVIVNCDYYIVDRSALMIEAGITGKPILYVNAETPEKMTLPVEKIVNTYYQAHSYDEINFFLKNIVINGNDPLYEKRKAIFNSVIKTNTYTSGHLIKEDIVKSLLDEKKHNVISDKNPIPINRSLRKYVTNLYRLKEIQDYRIQVERKKIMNHLSYRLGYVLVDSLRTPFGFLKIPLRLKNAYADYKKNKKLS